MGNRELRTMLRILRECGVQSFESGELKVTFSPIREYRASDNVIDTPIADAPKPEPPKVPQFEDPLEALFYHERAQ